jgi:uncharacterized protein
LKSALKKAWLVTAASLLGFAWCLFQITMATAEPGPNDKLPWAGTFKGKHEIANFFAQVGEHLEFSEFAPREMIEQGDTVVVLGTLEGRAKKTGKTVKNEWAHVFKYSNGKVVFFQEYIDTAAGVLAMS